MSMRGDKREREIYRDPEREIEIDFHNFNF